MGYGLGFESLVRTFRREGGAAEPSAPVVIRRKDVTADGGEIKALFGGLKTPETATPVSQDRELSNDEVSRRLIGRYFRGSDADRSEINSWFKE